MLIEDAHQNQERRQADGSFSIGKKWEKIIFAARILATVVTLKNPAEIPVVSSRQYDYCAVLTFAGQTGAINIADRFTPGSSTNYVTRWFKETRVIIVIDPHVSHQAMHKALFVDIAIPGNVRGRHSVVILWCLLCRTVLRLKGGDLSMMPGMFFYHDPEKAERKAQGDVGARH
ncbi:40S ribosomal protein uS2 [Mycosarcoma maydis]|uniref:Uncharacterized protein n=1 Tax=Mycosarcoma maydis TaxID=5270 RepID=A0A0D1DNJ7_MYCMD|nr:uncharacterized protein UMAG_11603 [Ustilago maydis 521]KIS66004.1 hypothetical protein UMAG_11603 [Ustilago maydis 521]|eukprot:XP_011392511.1 hypothetical protein UMAG_11603 [Ustilago maydis 521]